MKLKNSIEIVFVTPEIPGNTGNMGRSCAATSTKFHLVRPLGFNIDDKSAQRAGLDYWPYLDLEVHDSLEEFLEKYKERRMYLATTKADKLYSEVNFKDGDMILFGAESKGLPINLINEKSEWAIRIPLGKDLNLRSLNLSNAGNIILFEALRQLGFPGQS